jgi:DNA-binding transcriptional LysR family regulator
MKSVNLRRHNLNALPILREILRHGNLTRAAEALGLTQPALSNMLRQLRLDFADPLIVRNGKAMQLTPKAVQLMQPLEASLSSLEALLAQRSFDPATATNRFRIATTDHIMTMFAPPMMQRMLAEAPHVKLNLGQALPGTAQALMVGDLEMVITPSVLLSSGLADSAELANANTELLLRERFVCIAHKDDAAFAAGLSRAAYLARSHIGYGIGDRVSSSLEQVELTRMAAKQNDMILLSSYAAMPGIVAATGCLALIPESLARRAATLLPLQYAPPPLPLEPVDWMMVWHLRHDDDPAMHWLRQSLMDSVADLDAGHDDRAGAIVAA